MDELLKVLNDCYRHELTTTARYVHYSIVVPGMDRLHLAEFFKANAEDSMGHAAKIGSKILALGGTPEGKITEDLGAAPADPRKMLEQALKDEETAVALYTKAVPLAKNQLSLREMLVHILKDEQAGVDELQLLLKK